MTHYGAEHPFGARVSDAWTYRGLRTVIVENELLKAVLLADKGANVISLVHKPTDTEYLWRSPWGVRDQRLYTASTGDATAQWLDHYEGGWQTVLPGGGYPSSYANADLGLHGEANLMPWDVRIDEEGPDRASATLRVRLTRTPFVVTKTVSTAAGRLTMSFAETVTNVGGQDFPISYGQHIALGPPFLSGDCVLDMPGGTVHTHPTPYSPNHRLAPGERTPWPRARLLDGTTADLRQVPPVGAGFEDQCYIEDMPDGWYAVTNTATRVGLAVRYPHELYRYLWYWQVFSGGHGYPWWGQTYNVGLEPFTSATNEGLRAAIDNGSALVVPAGATIESDVLVTAYLSATGVRSVGRDGSVELREGE